MGTAGAFEHYDSRPTTDQPDGDPTSPACQQIIRNAYSGGAANVDLSFTNQGRAKVSGVDLQLNWSKMLAAPLGRRGFVSLTMNF